MTAVCLQETISICQISTNNKIRCDINTIYCKTQMLQTYNSRKREKTPYWPNSLQNLQRHVAGLPFLFCQFLHQFSLPQTTPTKARNRFTCSIIRTTRDKLIQKINRCDTNKPETAWKLKIYQDSRPVFCWRIYLTLRYNFTFYIHECPGNTSTNLTGHLPNSTSFDCQENS